MLCGDLYSLIRLCRFRTANSHGRALRAYRDHERILEAIGDRDGDLAEILMRRTLLRRGSSSCRPTFGLSPDLANLMLAIVMATNRGRIESQAVTLTNTAAQQTPAAGIILR